MFYTVVGAFLAFFGSFAFGIFPAREMLHPHGLADAISAVAPAFFLPLISIFRNWTYAMFYLMAELWGSVVLSLLFWGFANEINTVDEAKNYYPLFGLVANVALIFSGQYVRLVSLIRGSLPDGVDKWGHSLKLLMTGVLGCGAALLGIFTFMQQKVVPGPADLIVEGLFLSPRPLPHPCLSLSSILSLWQVITDPECVVPKDENCVDVKKKSKPKVPPVAGIDPAFQIRPFTSRPSPPPCPSSTPSQPTHRPPRCGTSCIRCPRPSRSSSWPTRLTSATSRPSWCRTASPSTWWR